MKPFKVVATTLVAICLNYLSISSASAEELPLGLKLPTYNKYIFGSEPQKFYMYTDRNFEGKT